MHFWLFGPGRVGVACLALHCSGWRKKTQQNTDKRIADKPEADTYLSCAGGIAGHMWAYG